MSFSSFHLDWHRRREFYSEKPEIVPPLQRVWHIEKGLPIDFKGKLFVFTGFYDNDPLMQAVIDRGGTCHPRITSNVDYLIVNPGEAGEGKIKEVLKKRGKGIFIHVILVDELEKRLKETPLP